MSSELGFTLIECVIVLVLISILMSLALPRLDLTRYRMDAATRQARAALQKGQRLAVTRQFNVVVSFDVTNNSIRVFEDRDNNDAVDATETKYWYPLEDGVRFGTAPQGVDGGSTGGPVVGSDLQTIDGMPSVIFRRDGSASTEVQLYLTSPRAETLDWRAVSLVKATGRADWSRYLGGTTWILGGA